MQMKALILTLLYPDDESHQMLKDVIGPARSGPSENAIYRISTGIA